MRAPLPPLVVVQDALCVHVRLVRGTLSVRVTDVHERETAVLLVEPPTGAQWDVDEGATTLLIVQSYQPDENEDDIDRVLDALDRARDAGRA